MYPGLTPKALGTTAGTEVKVARQLEVDKDPFHSLRVCLLDTPALTPLSSCSPDGDAGGT